MLFDMPTITPTVNNTTTTKSINEIIKSYNFHSASTEEELLTELADMFYMIYTCNYDAYSKVANKIWVYDEIIPDIIKYCAEDLNSKDSYLHALVECVKECYNLATVEQVLQKAKNEVQSTLEEWGCVFIQSVSEVMELLEINDNTLLLPEKWCSPKLYKQVGEFLKTFDCNRVKVKKRVGYKNSGEFTCEQIIHIGKKLNGVSLSEKFDFYPTPKELVERVQELAEITDDCTILEPSAGTGSLIDGLNKSNTTCVEINEVLATILEEKGYNVYNGAFEDYTENVKYDRIIMNPPFGKRMDAKHIVKAFNQYLKEGGILVAIHSSGIVSTTDKHSKEFQKLYSEYGVVQESYTNNEFKNSGKGTNINTMISKFKK